MLLVASEAAARDRIVLVPFTAVRDASAQDASRFTALMESQLGLENLLWTPEAPQRHESPMGPALQEARKLYRLRRFTQARATLLGALDTQQKVPAAFDANATAAAYVMLGAMDLRAGSERRTRAALRDALRLSPSYRPPRGEYPPIFLRELERARRDVSRLPHLTLIVEGPDGAEVFFDGKRVGILPDVRVRAVAGAHHLSLKGVKGEEVAEWIDLTRSTRIPLYFPPAPEPSPLPALAGNFLTEDFANALARALTDRKAPLAAVGVVTRGVDGQVEAHAALFVRDGKTFIPVEPVHFDPSFRAAEGEALVLTERLAEARGSQHAPVALPFDLAPAPKTVTPPLATATTPPREPIRGAPTAPELSPRTSATSSSALATPVGETASTEEEGSFFSRVPTWVWIAGGVGLAAGAGATAYALTRHSGGVTGTVEATW